jgi:hypothetical protein
MAVCSQLKLRTQLIDESLQESATTTQQLAHMALVEQPQHFIQREGAHVYVDGISDQEIKHKLIVGGDKMLNEASSLTLMLEATKAAAKTLARLREDRTPGRGQPTLTGSRGNQ